MKEPSTLASLILPREVFEHFEIVATQADEQQVHLYLDQKNDPPARHDYTYTSKGFTEQTIVQDFPLRGVPVLLHIRRRKWLEEPTEQIVTAQFELTHSGTQLSPKCSAFLKELHRA